MKIIHKKYQTVDLPKLRDEAGITQHELAKLANCNRSWIARLEAEEVTCTKDFWEERILPALIPKIGKEKIEKVINS